MKHTLLTPIHSFGALPSPSWRARWRWQLVGLLLTLLLLMGSRVQAAPIVFTVGATGGATYPTIVAAVPPPLPQPYELRLIDAAPMRARQAALVYLAAAVGVDSQIGSRLAQRQGLFQGRGHEFGGHLSGLLPAHAQSPGADLLHQKLIAMFVDIDKILLSSRK